MTARPVLVIATLAASLRALPSVTVPAEFVTVRLVAAMAADWVMLSPAVSVTMLPAIPATSKPLKSV